MLQTAVMETPKCLRLPPHHDALFCVKCHFFSCIFCTPLFLIFLENVLQTGYNYLTLVIVAMYSSTVLRRLAMEM
ncbi:hypothetical protein GQ600_18818 [Phytophthora cactorum]|nr:hypothetical protein GQ600_18818 [Phytophthora cactorum]